MDLPKMDESCRGDDRTGEEARLDIGKDLELGQPRLDLIHDQLNEENPMHFNEDLLFDSIPPLAPVADSLLSGPQTNNRKRKGIENQGGSQSTEKAENEHSCMEKQEDDSPSKKKNIVREARNLSERKRRGKISEKFQQLQELLPQSSCKVSQASILEGAVTYIKSTTRLLQMLAKMSPENAKAIEQFCSCKFA